MVMVEAITRKIIIKYKNAIEYEVELLSNSE